MTRSLSAALALGAALLIAGPAAAQPDSAPQTAPAASQQMPMGPGQGRMGRGMGAGMGRGMMGGRNMGRGSCQGMMGMMGMGGRQGGMSMMRHPDGTLAFLKAELKITGAQAKAWDKFAKAMRDSTAMMQATMQSHMREGPPTTLAERFDRREAMMTAHLESLRATKAALVPLYDALDAGQKATLDGMMMPCKGRGMGMGANTDSTDDDADE